MIQYFRNCLKEKGTRPRLRAGLGVPLLGASTTKKVVIDRFDRAQVKGFVNPQAMTCPTGVELLSLDGQVTIVPYEQITVLSFVRDWEGKSVLGERREFLARPKTAGLWVELIFRDGDRLEGVVPSNLLLLDSAGYSVAPPETAGNAQRLFVPRQALRAVNVLGVVGAKKARPPRRESAQISLFPAE
jgi:hypothetical protein